MIAKHSIAVGSREAGISPVQTSERASSAEMSHRKPFLSRSIHEGLIYECFELLPDPDKSGLQRRCRCRPGRPSRAGHAAQVLRERQAVVRGAHGDTYVRFSKGNAVITTCHGRADARLTRNTSAPTFRAGHHLVRGGVVPDSASSPGRRRPRRPHPPAPRPHPAVPPASSGTAGRGGGDGRRCAAALADGVRALTLRDLDLNVRHR